MNTGLRIINASLLLLSGMASAFANPGNHWIERDAVHAEQRQEMLQRREALTDEQKMERRAERRRTRGLPPPDNGGQNAQGDMSPNAVPDSNKKAGKLSPEERRALRRQINEAGQDLYAPKH